MDPESDQPELPSLAEDVLQDPITRQDQPHEAEGVPKRKRHDEDEEDKDQEGDSKEGEDKEKSEIEPEIALLYPSITRGGFMAAMAR